MTIKDLIKGKDYEYIARVNVLPNGQRDVVGFFKIVNGKIFSSEGQTYPENEEIFKYEEWSLPEDGIRTSLTIFVR